MQDLLTLENRYVTGWPKADDARSWLENTTTLFTKRYDTDVHYTAYTCPLARRLNAEALTHPDFTGAQMVAAIFDVDGPKHERTAAWVESEAGKLHKLEDAHPGGFVYLTRGGYRIVFLLPAPVPIESEADAKRWFQTYTAWRGYLKERFDIDADAKVSHWNSLFRVPHGARDGEVQEHDTIGDPGRIGVWSVEVNLATPPEQVAKPSPVTAHAAAPDISDPDELIYRQGLFVKACQTMPPSVQGEGGDLALFKVVQRGAYDLQLPTDDVLEIVRQHFDPRCIPPWGGELESRVRHKAESAKTKSTRPRGEPVPWDIAGSSPAPPPPPHRKDDGVFWDDWDEPLPPVEWLIEGLVPAGTVGAFVAHGSSLKTWTMLSLAASVAKGQAWLGKYAVKKGKVLVLDYESGRYELRRRVLILEKGKVVGLGAWSYPSQRLDDAELWKQLAKDYPDVALVCADSLAEGSSPGVDENSKDAAFPLQLAARFTEATGASVLFVHHSKKDDSGDARKAVRGSTAIYAALDWCYAFENVEENTLFRRMLMTSIKPCMGSKPPPVPLELSDKGLGTFEPKQRPTKDSSPEEIQKAILLHLSAGPIENKKKIAKKLNLRNENVGPEVDALVVRREIVFLKGVGFAVDSPELRQGRVVKAINDNQHWRSEAELAEAAGVQTSDIGLYIRTGVVCKSGDGRFIVVTSNE